MRFFAPSRGFVLLYALAFTGVFVSFMPFVMVLLPLKVAAVAGDGKTALLSAAALGGAAVASVANIFFGALSDRTRRLKGTRRPWIGLGMGLLVVSYGTLHLSSGATSLLAAVAMLQIALNMLFAPIIAVMADEVPDAQKGLVAGLLGAAQPAGSLAAVLITLPGLEDEGARYAMICGLFTLMILPFLLLAREAGVSTAAARAPVGRLRFDFGLAWASRMLVQVAGNAIATYGFFYFLTVPGPGGQGTPAQDAIVLAMSGATILAVGLTIAAGRASDRMMRRKPFLAAAALAMAGGLLTMASAGSWSVAVLGYGLALGGVSIFLAVHSALTMQLLPSPEHRGRDLGVINLTNTLPAMIAPLLAFALDPDTAGYGPMLVTLAMAALAGGAVATAVRSQA